MERTKTMSPERAQLEEELKAAEARDKEIQEDIKRATEALAAATRPPEPTPPPTPAVPPAPAAPLTPPAAPTVRVAPPLTRTILGTPTPLGVEPRAAEGPSTPEESAARREVESLTSEDQEKLGFGMNVIGFKVEKIKNDLFAGALGKGLSKVDSKGTAGRFFISLRDVFIRDAKDAEKKGLNIQKGNEKGKLAKFKNIALLAGNVLKYGRIIADVTGASIANPLRYVMMGGMATARLGEAGKEARLLNEEVIEKTRIQDADAAYKEAMEIYEKAQLQSEKSKVSSEDLKDAYLKELPQDLKRKLAVPGTANSFIQKIIKKDIESGLNSIDNSISKIEKNGELSVEEKQKAVEKILKKHEKRLRDYDRIITQYGTVDALAMAGSYAQTAGKAIVAGMQIETAVVSLEKLFNSVSNLLSSNDIIKDAPSNNINSNHGPNFGKDVHLPNENTNIPSRDITGGKTGAIEGAEKHIDSSSNAAEAVSKSEGVVFEKGKGGIQGLLDLKAQMRAKYPDLSKLPKDMQDFLNNKTRSGNLEMAKRLGFFSPDQSDESAQILKGSSLRYDEKLGKIIFHDARTEADMDKYTGKMFDSDHSGTVGSKNIANLEEERLANKENAFAKLYNTPEEARGKILANLDTAEEAKNKMFSKVKFGEIAADESITTAKPKVSAEALSEQIKARMTSNPEVGKNVIYNSNGGTRIMPSNVTETGRGPGGVNVRVNNMVNELPNNSYNLPPEVFKQVQNTYGQNLSHLYSDYLNNKEATAWITNDLMKQPAKNIIEDMKDPKIFEDKFHGPLVKYFQKIQEILGEDFKPKGKGWNPFGKSESTEEYIKRALIKAAQLGKLDKVKM